MKFLFILLFTNFGINLLAETKELNQRHCTITINEPLKNHSSQSNQNNEKMLVSVQVERSENLDGNLSIAITDVINEKRDDSRTNQKIHYDYIQFLGSTIFASFRIKLTGFYSEINQKYFFSNVELESAIGGLTTLSPWKYYKKVMLVNRKNPNQKRVFVFRATCVRSV